MSSPLLKRFKHDCSHSAALKETWQGETFESVAAWLAEKSSVPEQLPSSASVCLECRAIMRTPEDREEHQREYDSHCVSMSFADLSVTCSACEGEPLEDELSGRVFSLFHAAKYGRPVIPDYLRESEDGDGAMEFGGADPSNAAAKKAPESNSAHEASSKPTSSSAAPDAGAEQEMFGVYPISNCPHLAASLSPMLEFELSDPCLDCGHVGENWVCLTCSKVYCSRYVKEHMLAHHLACGPHTHNVVFSFSDLSYWCYRCESYIKHESLRPISSAAHVAKFGRPLPSAGAPLESQMNFGVPKDTTEFFDTPEDLDLKAKQLADLIRECSGSVMVFTGAGVSTSAKIPDYRGPNGVWTMKAKGQKANFAAGRFELTQPTLTHRAIKTLLDAGIVHHVVSTNVDGLHLRSGIPERQLTELHGNVYKEQCPRCRRVYTRHFDVRRCIGGEEKGSDHKTGRNCETQGCGEALCDTIIAFGETLPPREVMRALQLAGRTDLHIVLGSSLSVAPASEIPLCHGRVVIVNLQKTSKDTRADLRVFAKCDEFMEKVMAHLGIAIPDM